MLDLFFNNDDTLEIVTIQLIEQLEVDVTHPTIRKVLQQHPNYPSLTTISDSLTSWKIDNVAIKTTYEELDTFPLPVIVYLKGQEEDLVIITEKEGDQISILNKQNKKTVLGKQTFLNHWTGVTMIVNKTNESGDPNFKRNKKREQWKLVNVGLFLFSVLIFGLFCTFNLQHINSDLANRLAYLLFYIISFSGILVTSLLLLYEINSENKALKKICSSKKNINCEAVLNSNHSNIFDWLNLSEIGFLFFTGNFLILIIASLNTSLTNNLLTVVNYSFIVSIPFVFFSIYSQWRIIKQWCLLCLVTQLLLALGAIVVIFTAVPVQSIETSPLILFQSVVFTLIGYLTPFIIWKSLKNSLLTHYRLKGVEKEFNRLKANRQIFEMLLTSQKKIEPVSSSLGIFLGNPNAKNKIIKVCNPYCGPCAKAHPEIEKLLDEYKDDLCLQVIFSASDDVNDIRSLPVKHFLSIHNSSNEIMTKRALSDWYNAEEKNYQEFNSKYPLETDINAFSSQLNEMHAWTTKNDITFTPTFFINGYQLPELYSIRDMPYFFN